MSESKFSPKMDFIADSILPKAPPSSWIDQWAYPSLIQSKPYAIDVNETTIKLDQNECPWDFPLDLKTKVLSELTDQAWNRYPPAFGDDVHQLLADYVGTRVENILMGAGSSHLITLVLNALAQRVNENGGKILIARPTFPLYESHCRYMGLSYEPWPLTENFEFDLKSLSTLPPHSIVAFASPNNPVGNRLRAKDLQDLLEVHPESLFIADEAYSEFTDESYVSLLNKHSNLLVLRTLSKSLGAAALRMGYLVAHQQFIDIVKKLRLPFMFSPFSFITARHFLTNPQYMKLCQERTAEVIQMRESLREALNSFQNSGAFRVIPSHANFLLIQWSSQQACHDAYRSLIEKKIQVRDVSSGPGLEACLRMSIGKKEENEAFLKAIREFL